VKGQTAPQKADIEKLTGAAEEKIKTLRSQALDLERMKGELDAKHGAVVDVDDLWKAVERLRDALGLKEPKRG
jgi:hypothetical protein